MFLPSHFRGYDLNSVGYCLLGCDVIMSGGNLQMCLRNAHYFLAQLQNTLRFKPYATKILKSS